MADDPRLADLLLAWEESQAGGKAVTLTQLCRDCPDLLAPLRLRVDALKRMGTVLDIGKHDTEGPKGPEDDPPTRRADSRAPQDSFWGKVERSSAQRLPSPPGYEVLGELDRGGMAVVYKARQVALDRLVALKVVLAGPNARPSDLARFQTEARAVARLAHPNIVQIHDVGAIEGYPYLVLEFLEGGDLESALRGVLLPPAEAVPLLEKLARAVHHANAQGIIHRDIKPGNVLLTRYRRLPGGKVELGEPKLADFGLARCLGDVIGITRTGVILGTPSYMAPEQVSGTKALIGPATDVHGLGALLYRVLTGMPPFIGDGDLAIGQQVLKQLPVAPSRHNPEVPAALDQICLRCLQKEPADRYANAADLADDLKCWLDGRPVAASASARSDPASSLAFAWIVAGVAVAVAGGMLIAHFWLGW